MKAPAALIVYIAPSSAGAAPRSHAKISKTTPTAPTTALVSNGTVTASDELNRKFARRRRTRSAPVPRRKPGPPWCCAARPGVTKRGQPLRLNWLGCR